MSKPIAGGSNGASGLEVALPRQRSIRPRPGGHVLENERLLAFALLSPTVVLLGMFIAYPFVMGVWLSLSSTSVGNIGEFVGARNFVKAWNDSIFQTAFKNTFIYTFWKIESFQDRKSTRLNSSHVATSYAVFCL